MTEQTPTKKELRRGILAQRKALSEEEAKARSAVICARLSGSDLYREAEDICIYMPINREVDVTLLIRPAQEDGKRIWIPKVTGDEMIFNAYEEDLLAESEGFHILESSSETVLEPDGRTLVIMPGSVFDLNGNRIGYGGGYYDKYLERHPECRTAAVCYDFQIVERIPAEAHDIRPEYIFGETKTLQRT